MSDVTPLTTEQTVTLWALDLDVCALRPFEGRECPSIAAYTETCKHCDYTRPLCLPHSVALMKVVQRGEVIAWRCERCLSMSADYWELFHLHGVEDHHE